MLKHPPPPHDAGKARTGHHHEDTVMTAEHTLRAPPGAAQTRMKTPDIFEELTTIRRTGVGVLIFVAALVALAAAILVSDGSDERALAQVTLRANKLRAENAVKEAQINALTRLLADRPEQGMIVLRVGDRYATERLSDAATGEKTYEEVRREVCAMLADASVPCSP